MDHVFRQRIVATPLPRSWADVAGVPYWSDAQSRAARTVRTNNSGASSIAP